MSPERRRLRRSYQAWLATVPRMLSVSFRVYVRAVARGVFHEGYPRHREDARTWCLRKWPGPRPHLQQPQIDVAGRLRRERDQAHEALRELLSFALGVEVPREAVIEPQAVVRQVRLSCGGIRG